MPTTQTHPERRKTVRRRRYTPPTPAEPCVFTDRVNLSPAEVDQIRENAGFRRGGGGVYRRLRTVFRRSGWVCVVGFETVRPQPASANKYAKARRRRNPTAVKPPQLVEPSVHRIITRRP